MSIDVQTETRNINTLFSSTTYYIDFYQRQYKWTDEPVKRLLNDIFYKFEEEYNKYKDSASDINEVIHKYAWYYLNTYVTNRVDGKLYIVDGQQRLTTLNLILIKLKHLAHKYKSDLEDWIKQKIAGRSGFKDEFWMNHEAHISSMQGLLDGLPTDRIDTKSGLTAQNMINNYKVISSYIDNKLIDLKIFESFTFYFMNRLFLINLNIEQTDVPMVFEVINDRGIKLKPYEILKGKLLGQISKKELETLKLNELWDEQVSKINLFSEDEIDQFFTYFLKAKFADTKGGSNRYDNDYHRIMLSENKLNLDHNAQEVIKFLQKDFAYYTNLYLKILSFYNFDNFKEDFAHIYFNSLNDMNMQRLLILSSCDLNDSQEDEKMKLISYEVDKLFCLLQLQRSWDSNAFTEEIYRISTEIRNKNLSEIKTVFNKALLELLSKIRGVEASMPLSYGFFKETGIELGNRFKRYFFARIEKFIADNTNLRMKHTFHDLINNKGSVNGFHIEHILAKNEENFLLFDKDEEKFESERNRLGGLLLLKGRDNISSNNEVYANKLKSYANTLYWNETLREDSYKSKHDFTSMIEKFSLKFRAMNEFGQAELEERHKLLYDIINIIWR